MPAKTGLKPLKPKLINKDKTKHIPHLFNVAVYSSSSWILGESFNCWSMCWRCFRSFTSQLTDELTVTKRSVWCGPVSYRCNSKLIGLCNSNGQPASFPRLSPAVPMLPKDMFHTQPPRGTWTKRPQCQPVAMVESDKYIWCQCLYLVVILIPIHGQRG